MTHDFSIYARTLTIADGGVDPAGPPVHVASRIRLDGKTIPGVLSACIDFAKGEPTTVTLEVLAEHVAVPFQTSDGTYTAGGIGEHAVLTPPLDAYPWETFNAVDDSCLTSLSSDYPIAEVLAVRCHFYIARVVFE